MKFTETRSLPTVSICACSGSPAIMRQAMTPPSRFSTVKRQSLVVMSPLPSYIAIIFVLSPGELFRMPSASNENSPAEIVRTRL